MLWEGVGRFPEGPTVGKWNWNLPLVPIDLPFLPYQVLGTDYSSYASVYSCINLGSFHLSKHSWIVFITIVRFFFFIKFYIITDILIFLEQLWIMTKKYPLFAPPTAVPAGIDVIQKAGLNTTLLLPSVQLFCPLPEFNWFNLFNLF